MWKSGYAPWSAAPIGISHASYIEHWLRLLRDDDRAILTAAAKAEEAASLLLKLGGRAIADNAGEPDDIALAA